MTSRPQAIAFGVAVLAGFVFAYYGAFSLLLNTWSNSNTYSHGVLVPFVSAYLAWSVRHRLLSTPAAPSLPAGSIMLVVSCLVLIAGYVSSIATVQQVSVLMAVPSLILLMLGRRKLLELALPTAYLVFMVPVLDFLINRIQWPFQLISAKAAVTVLKLFGVPVFLNSQYIELPNVTLEVARACSGVQYLVAIVALAIPLAYLNLRGNGMRALFLALAVVIGIASNWLRVIFIAIWSINGGDVLHGPMHIFQGLFVAVFGFIVLFALSLILARIQASGDVSFESQAQRVPEAFWRGSGSIAAAVCALVVLLATGSYVHFLKQERVGLAEPLKSFPMAIAGWKGTDGSNSPKRQFHIYNADSTLRRIYTDTEGRQVELQIAYFERQSQGSELINYTHNPLYEASSQIDIPTEEGMLKVNHAVQSSGPREYQVLYWYNVGGRDMSGIYPVQLSVLMDGLLKRRTNGYMVVISWSQSKSDQETPGVGLEFARNAMPVISSRLRTF